MRRIRPLIVLVVCVVVFSVAHLYTTQRTASYDPVADHASFRTNEWGTRALRELLGRCGLKTASWSQPWTSLSRHSGVLWVIAPLLEPEEEEVRALLQWVKGGGWVIIAPDLRVEARGLYLGDRSADEDLLRRLGWEGIRGQVAEAHVPVRKPEPLLRDVQEVVVPGPWRLRELGTGPRAATTARPGVRGQARGRMGGTWSEAVLRVQEPKSAPPTGKEAPVPVVRLRGQALLEDVGGLVLARVPYGNGRIILLCDADILSNRHLPRGDNVVLAANLAFAPPGMAQGTGTIWFDEYHHGLQRPVGESTGLDVRAPRRTLLAILAAVALFCLGRLWRFGTPVPAGSPPRRSSLEYVQAFASLYQRAGQRAAALGVIERRFRTQLALIAGMRADTDGRLLAEAVGRRCGRVDPTRLADLLSRCEAARQPQAPLSDLVLMGLVRDIWRTEQELTRHE